MRSIVVAWNTLAYTFERSGERWDEEEMGGKVEGHRFNVRLHVGKALSSALHGGLSSRVIPLLREVPWGISSWYDTQRIAGRRNLPTILDVGANTGQTAAGLKKYFPDSTIHCFEPAAEPFAILSDKAKTWPRVHVHRLALGHEAGEARMRVHSGHKSELNTLAWQSSDIEADSSFESVGVQTLDAFCVERGIAHIDILKLDVQGWEINVLRGADRLFSSNAIDFVFAEAAFLPSSEMIEFEAIHRAMVERNFVLSGIYDCFRWGRKFETYFCNCLYTRRAIARRD